MITFRLYAVRKMLRWVGRMVVDNCVGAGLAMRVENTLQRIVKLGRMGDNLSQQFLYN